ncbi:MAG TPA: hypothetical protein PKL88_02705, partial [bacterium]|nr:hypothetical protein [bacterium]
MPNFESLVAEESPEIKEKSPNPLESEKIENGTINYIEEPEYVVDLEKFFSDEGLILKKDDITVERVVLVSIDGSFLSIDREG